MLLTASQRRRPVQNLGEALMTLVRRDKPKPSLDRFEFDLRQVQATLTRFREEIQALLIRTFSARSARYYWSGTCFEEFDEAKELALRAEVAARAKARAAVKGKLKSKKGRKGRGDRGVSRRTRG